MDATADAAVPPPPPTVRAPSEAPVKAGAKISPYYFDNKNFLRQQQTDMTVNTKQAIEGQFGPELLEYMHDYVEEQMEQKFNMQKECIPSADVPAHCDIFLSNDYATRKHLLVLVACKRDTPPGIWSRGLCLSHGLDVGSMLPVIKKATDAGYGIAILNPKKNSIEDASAGEDGAETRPVKIMIEGSKNAEEHIVTVWDRFLAPSEATNISFLTCTEGADLVNHLVKERPDLQSSPSRIGGCAFVEPGKTFVKSADGSLERFMAAHAVVLERPTSKSMDTTGDGAVDTFHYDCHQAGGASDSALTLSLPSVNYDEIPQATKDAEHASNVALGMVVTLPHVMDLFALAKADADAGTAPASAVTGRFLTNLAASLDLAAPTTVAEAAAAAAGGAGSKPTSSKNPFKKFFTGLGFFNEHSHHDEKEQAAATAAAAASASAGGKAAAEKKEPLGPDDFELLQVVGKGGFGKVFLVRKKIASAEDSADKVYAMKVLTKSQIYRDNQVEHTHAERRILAGIEHPYLVRLRYAFQTSKKLYMIMDYYSGGCLFFHLRRQRRFSFEQACFYAAELMLAMNYLHSLDIIYRDVKLENVLMDKNGHVHLTDFGLSKEGVMDNYKGAETFCGTAEYVAPELLQQKPYGKAADWWSFGILLYEMITGKTPFFSRNRSQMFHSITHNNVQFPNGFPPDAVDIITKMLNKDPTKRIGCIDDGSEGTLEEKSLRQFQAHPYFAKIDWAKMEAKQLDPPYKPTVKNDMDTKYVHKVFLQQPVVDEQGNDVVNADDVNYDTARHFENFEFSQDEEHAVAGAKLED